MPIQTRKHHHRQPVVEVGSGKLNGVVGVAETPRLNKMEFDENDEKIITATLKAFESGSLTPLIKEELRCTIQSRRIAEGKGEMKVEFKAPVRKKEMDDDERKRALKRRQQNREAAQRFRQKQKDTSDYLTTKIRRLERSAKSLCDDMNRLKEEKELLGQMLNDHLKVCSNPHIQADSFVFATSETTQIPTTIPLHLISTSSSNDSHLLYDCTPSTAASDASVFFSDDNLISPVSAEAQDNNTTTQMITLNIEDLDKHYNSTAADNNNIILYDGPLDGPLDACYEEIVIDFGQEDTADYLRNDVRTRGDSCSSVDTVSSHYSYSNASELTSLSESTTDLRNSISSVYSRVHADSCSLGPFDTTPSIAEDFFLMDDSDL